jgi:competence protein ComFB
MGIVDEYDLDILENEAESLVIHEMEKRLLDDAGSAICRCQDCILDMVALALNAVKPLYRASLLGTLYARAAADTGYAHEIKDAVSMAIAKVTANPSHDLDGNSP